MQDRQFSHGYSGELHDRSGLLPYGFRTYDPAAGRWSSSDPAQRQGSDRTPLNFYQMVDGNPVTDRDDRGLMRPEDLYRLLKLMVIPTGVPREIMNTLMPVFVFAYADAKALNLIDEWRPLNNRDGFHPIDWVDNPRSFGSFHRVSLDEMIRRLDLPFEVHGDVRRIITRFAAEELLRKEFRFGNFNDPNDDQINDTEKRFTRAAWEGLRQYELGFGGARLVHAAMAVWKYQALGRGRALGHGIEEAVGLSYSQARDLQMLAVLSASMYYQKTKRIKNLFRDRTLLNHVENVDFAKTGVPLLGGTRDTPFTTEKFVMSDMRKIFDRKIGILQPIMARLLYELGIASYRGAIDLSKAILQEQKQVIRHISKDKKRNKVDYYDVAKIIRDFRARRNSLSIETIREIKLRQEELRQNRRELQISKRVDRSRIPGRQISIMDYYRSYGDFQRYDKIKTFKSRTTERHRIPDSGLPMAVSIVSQNYTYEEPRFHHRLKSKEIDLIIADMKYEIYASLRLGATLRHKADYSQPFHQHLLNRNGAFSVAYERISGDNTHLRAVIYDYGNRKKGDKYTVYKWRYGNHSGGPSRPIPKDLQSAMVPPGKQGQSNVQDQPNRRGGGRRQGQGNH